MTGSQADDGHAAIPALPRWARFSEPRQRLWAELKRTEAEMAHAVDDNSSGNHRRPRTVACSTEAATEEGKRLLDAASEALRRGQLEASWALVHDARRALVALLTPEERRAVAVSIRSLATEKMLTSSRGASILKLLPEGTFPTVEALTEALLHVDTTTGNEARKSRNLRHELFVLLAVLLLTALAAFIYIGLLGTGTVVSFRNGNLLVLAPLFGILGAAISSIQGISGRPSMKVPQLRGATYLNLMRLGMGAAASLVVLAGVQTANPDAPVGAALLACFAGGFSERFILRFIPDAERSKAPVPPTGSPGATVTKPHDLA